MKYNETLCRIEYALSVLFFVTLAGFFPLFYGAGYSVILPAKYTAFQIIAVFFGCAFFALSVLKKDKKRLFYGCFSARCAPTAFLFLFYAVLIISALLSPYLLQTNSGGLSAVIFGSGRYDGLYVYGLYAVIFIISYKFLRFERRHILFLSAVLLLMSLFGIVQLFGVNLLNIYPSDTYTGYYDEFISTMGNIDFFSSLLCMLIPFCFASFMSVGFKRRESGFVLFSVFSASFCLIKTCVQSGIITLTAMFLIIIPLSLKKRENVTKALVSAASAALLIWLCGSLEFTKLDNSTGISFSVKPVPLFAAGLVIAVCISAILLVKKYYRRPIDLTAVRRMIFAFYGLLAAAMLIYVGLFFKPTRYEGAIFELYCLLHGEVADYSGSGRGGIWKYGFLLGLKRPLFGQGTGCYRLAMDDFAQNAGYTYYTSRNAVLDAAHNEFLQIFVTNGIFGLVSYLGFCVTLLAKAVKSFCGGKYVLPLFAAVTGYLIQSFFTFSVVEVTPIFWMFCGVLLSAALHTNNDEL